MDTFAATSQVSVRMAVKATLTQLLSTIAEKLSDSLEVPVRFASIVTCDIITQYSDEKSSVSPLLTSAKSISRW